MICICIYIFVIQHTELWRRYTLVYVGGGGGGGGGGVEDRIKSLSVFKLLAIKRYSKPDSLLITIYSWIGYPLL